jgi:hypothetical protein
MSNQGLKEGFIWDPSRLKKLQNFWSVFQKIQDGLHCFTAQTPPLTANSHT